MNNILVFLSHSSGDKELAERIVQLICGSLRIARNEIRCTSVVGCKLPAGADTPNQLLKEIQETAAFIGIMTAASSDSAYVLFELGARWATGKHFAPIIGPGFSHDKLRVPIAQHHNLLCSDVTDLKQLLAELSDVTGRDLQPLDSYSDLLNAVLEYTPQSETKLKAAKRLSRTLRTTPAIKEEQLLQFAVRRFIALQQIGFPCEAPDSTDLSSLQRYGMVLVPSERILIDQFPISEVDYLDFCNDSRRAIPHYLVGREPRSNYPVVHVSAYDADAFAAWSGKSLPTIEEWELAAYWQPDGSLTDYPWGTEFVPGRCNSFESNLGGPSSFTSFPDGCSAIGVYDIVGNCWEWTEGESDNRVFVGGSWYDASHYCRRNSKVTWPASGKTHDVGFRCVLPI